jgi:ABC-type nickel/cobalt efflux system permease component RcnA
MAKKTYSPVETYRLVHTQAHSQARTHTRTHKHMHTHTHTYTHIHIHTHTEMASTCIPYIPVESHKLLQAYVNTDMASTCVVLLQFIYREKLTARLPDS